MEPTIAETPVYKFLRQIVNDLNNENYKLKLNDIKQVRRKLPVVSEGVRGGGQSITSVLFDSFRIHILPVSINVYRLMSIMR